MPRTDVGRGHTNAHGLRATEGDNAETGGIHLTRGFTSAHRLTGSFLSTTDPGATLALP